MSSTLIVPVAELRNVRQHPNADKLDLCDVLGYQMVVPRGRHQDGDVVVYFPADTLLPDEWAVKFGVKNFLKGKDSDRVGRIRLRGESSFGLVVAMSFFEDQTWQVGDNVADYFGCVKYEPPVKSSSGDAAAYDSEIDPFIERYTGIEHGRIFTGVFSDGEEVVATEKIHGTNVKVGIVRGEVPFGSSMHVRRKRPINEDGEVVSLDSTDINKSIYWTPWSIPGVRKMMEELGSKWGEVSLYGEIMGGSIQSLDYGIPKGSGFGFMAFDLMLNHRYLSWDEFQRICDSYEVPVVPVLYRGAYTLEKMLELADGQTTIGGNHIREGIVVKPVEERVDPKIGRVVLKFIGTEYEMSKHKELDTRDV